MNIEYLEAYIKIQTLFAVSVSLDDRPTPLHHSIGKFIRFFETVDDGVTNPRLFNIQSRLAIENPC